MKFTETRESSDRTNTLIVDGLNLAFRFKHSKQRNFAAAFVSTMDSLASSYLANKVILLGDGGSTYRKRIYPEYKANRQKLIEEQTEQEKEEFKLFLEDFESTLKLAKNKYKIIRYRGVEADDIAAYITKHYSDKLNHIWLISSDKDWDLLINNKVSRFSYRTGKETRVDNWNKHYSYNIDDHISIKVLTGDKGDNVEGVKQIGEKRAESLIREYGTAFDIYDNLPIKSKYKYITNLNEFGDKLLLNYELMDLLTYCEEAIGKEQCQEINEIIENLLDERD